MGSCPQSWAAVITTHSASARKAGLLESVAPPPNTAAVALGCPHPHRTPSPTPSRCAYWPSTTMRTSPIRLPSCCGAGVITSKWPIAGESFARRARSRSGPDPARYRSAGDRWLRSCAAASSHRSPGSIARRVDWIWRGRGQAAFARGRIRRACRQAGRARFPGGDCCPRPGRTTRRCADCAGGVLSRAACGLVGGSGWACIKRRGPTRFDCLYYSVGWFRAVHWADGGQPFPGNRGYSGKGTP